MGCIKLDILEKSFVPMKVVYRNFGVEQKSVQRFLSVDPLAEKMQNNSPYCYAFNNPIFFIDKDGQIPTPAEAARMAAHVYGDKKDNILTGGWRVSTRDFGINKTDGTGLKSNVYERVVDGKVTEYTYATAGTEIIVNGKLDFKDAKADVLQVAGLSDQVSSAADNAKSISNTLGSKELTFVGHSLGGSEAALNAVLTDRSAITFNAAGVSDITKVVEGNINTPFKSESKINAYIMLTDPLNAIQNNNYSLPGMLMPDVNGNRNYLKPTDASSKYKGHSINNILKCFGIDPSKF